MKSLFPLILGFIGVGLILYSTLLIRMSFADNVYFVSALSLAYFLCGAVLIAIAVMYERKLKKRRFV